MNGTVTAVRLSETERKQLRRIGGGNMSAAIKAAIAQMLTKQASKPAA